MGMITLWQPHKRIQSVGINLQLAPGNVSSTCKPRLGDNMPLRATFVGWCSEASFTLQEWSSLQPTLTFLTPWVQGTHGSRPHHISCATTTQKPFYSLGILHMCTLCVSHINPSFSLQLFPDFLSSFHTSHLLFRPSLYPASGCAYVHGCTSTGARGI